MPPSSKQTGGAKEAGSCGQPDLPKDIAARPVGCEHCSAPVIPKLFQLHHMMMRAGDRLASQRGLTCSRWMFLSALGETDEPCTINELSERVNVSPQNASRMVASMDEDGLVHRFTKPGQGRSTFVGLTDSGWEAYETINELKAAFCPPFFEGLSESRIERLDKDLTTLIENVARLEADLIADPEGVLSRGEDS